MNRLYESIGESIFARMSALAARHGAVNLGQGFPDFGWPDDTKVKLLEDSVHPFRLMQSRYDRQRDFGG